MKGMMDKMWLNKAATVMLFLWVFYRGET